MNFAVNLREEKLLVQTLAEGGWPPALTGWVSRQAGEGDKHGDVWPQ